MADPTPTPPPIIPAAAGIAGAPATLPNSLVDAARLQALHQAQQAQQQQAMQPPTLAGREPAVLSFIRQMVHPTAQLQPGQNPQAPSRMDAFEHFLGTFLTSFAKGMGVAPGPGANERAASAAMMAPYQHDIQQWQMQQQAANFGAARQHEQAQANLANVQAGLAPQQLALQHQQVMAEIGLRQQEQIFNQDFKKAMFGLNTRKEDFNESIKKLDLDNQRYRTQIQAWAAKMHAKGIIGNLTIRQKALEQTRDLTQQRLGLTAEANHLRQEGLNQEADRLDMLAGQMDNKIGIWDEIVGGLNIAPRYQSKTGGRVVPVGSQPNAIQNRIPKPNANGNPFRQPKH